MFTVDTKIITEEEVVRLDTIAGQTVNLLTLDKIYRPAECKAYTKRKIFEVKFSSGQRFKCTANHNWLIYVDGEYEFVSTKDLQQKDKVPYVCGKIKKHQQYTYIESVTDLGRTEKVYCTQEPETHTMVLAGGILTGQCVE